MFLQQSLKHFFLDLNILLNTTRYKLSLITVYRTASVGFLQLSKPNFKNHLISLEALENNQCALILMR